jgi:hypothetical protein
MPPPPRGDTIRKLLLYSVAIVVAPLATYVTMQRFVLPRLASAFGWSVWAEEAERHATVSGLCAVAAAQCVVGSYVLRAMADEEGGGGGGGGEAEGGDARGAKEE